MQNTGEVKNGSASGDDSRAHGIPECEEDPHACRPRQWIGKTACFVYKGRCLVGEVFAVEYVGRRGPSLLADYRVGVRGSTGAKLLVSLYDTYMTFED